MKEVWVVHLTEFECEPKVFTDRTKAEEFTEKVILNNPKCSIRDITQNEECTYYLIQEVCGMFVQDIYKAELEE